MALPIKDGKITTPYGKKGKMWKSGKHTGVDFAVPTGTDILAACDGVVQRNNWGKAYGKQVIVKAKINGKNLWMIYAHCSKTFVKAGAKVTKGQHIAEVGSTGNSSGPHLHFEVRNGARWSASKDVNPQPVLDI
jgi:murein DD-endopeptidase MepM/ murein hydrolase activator NlpD